MKYSNTVEYNISTKLDSSGLQKLKTELQQVELTLQKMGNKKLLDGSFSEAREQIQGLGDALSKAFDPSLGVLDLSTFKAELQSSGVTAKGLKDAFTQAGSEGQIAFNNLIGQLGQLDTGIQRSNSQVDKLFTTFSNTFRWGLVSSFFSQFMNAIHSSVEYVKELDDSLTQIMLVTDYNRDSMNEFARSANEAAKAVSMTTTGMTNASLIFAQQGYDLGQSQELATLSAKVANASQQDTATTSDQITAYMNAYGLENSIGELTQAMDNWALIANISAADVGELAQASQRAASMANAVGVSGEALAAQIATIESVTREAPEQIGNGLKTLYARFSDISLGGEDEDGVGLGKVTSTLEGIGVKVLDQFGNIRTMDDIMEDLMVVWDDLDSTTKTAAAQALAGKYQVNRFEALMENSDMYRQYKDATGENATGTLDVMNEEYAQSLEGRNAKLQATLEGLFNDVFTTDMVYPAIDALTKLAEAIDTLFKSVGGGSTIILGLASAFTRLFSNNIAEQINNVSMNRAVQQQRIENSQNRGALLEQLKVANPDENNQNTQAIIDYAQRINTLAPNLSSGQWEQANQILKEMVQNANAATQAQGELKTQLESVGTAIGSVFGDKFKAPFLDDAGGINATTLIEDLKTANLADSKESIKETKEELLKFNQGLQEYQSELNKSEDEDKDFSNSLQMMSESLQVLKKYMEPGLYNRLNNVFKDLGESFDLGNASIEEITTTIKQFEGETGRVIEFLDKLSNKELSTQEIENFIKKLEELAFKVKNTESAAEGSNKVGSKYLEAADKQIDIKNIIDTAGAVGQLAFSWQAFQNLGSLWVNEDLTAGEKTLQTVTNLATTLPQIIPIINKISGNFFGNITSNLTEKINELKSNIDKAGQANLLIQERLNDIENKRISVNKKIETTIKNHGENAKSLASDYSKLNHLEQSRALLQKQLAAGTLTQEAYEKQIEAIDQRIVALKRAQIAATIGVSIALMAVSAAIGAIQEQERQRVQKITDDAEDSRSKLEAINSSDFFEKWDAFKENGELTDELKDSMAALAQQMGINIEAQDIYAGNIEQLNDKIRDNIELEKERARTNFEAENEEFETQLNKNSIQAAQVGGTVQTAAGTFNSAVDYIGQAGAAKSLAERLGEVANAQSAVTAARKEFGKDSLEYNNALNDYQKLRDQLKDDEVDIDKANSNFKQLADLAIEEFKAGRDAQSLTGADWISFLNSDGGAEVRDYMESLGEEAGLQFKLGLLSQSDSENPIYSMITAPGQIDLTKGNLSTTESTEWDFSNLMQSGIDPSELLGAEAGTKTWEDFAQAFIDAANNDTITINPNIKLENKYDFDSDEEINKYLEDYTDIDRATLNTAADLRMKNANQENDYEGYNKYNGEAEYRQSQIESAQQDIDSSTNIRDTKKATEELTEAQNKYNEALKQTDEDQKLYEKALQRAAAASARMSKTLDQMNDHFDDNKKILEEGNETTAEYAEALTETKQDLAGLLDVDLESIPNSLAQNPEILEDMNTLLHGTQEEAEAAYKEIQNIAAGEIIDNLDIPVGLTDSDGNEITAEQVQSTLHGLIDSLNAQDLSIDMEADINTDEWYARVNELLASGAITAEQLTQVLSSAGYEGEFSTQPGKGWAQEMSYDLEVSGFDVPEINGPTDLNKLAGMSGHIKMTPTASKTVPIETQVPVLKGATQKGGFVNNAGGGGGRRSGGGGGGGKKSCFVAGTLISTSLGFRPIEQIQKGDMVLSYNELFGRNEYSEVLQTMIHDTIEPIYTLYIKDEQLRVTGIHRFLVTDKITCGVPQWVYAADLKVGQWVFFADGTWHVIYKIETNIEHQIVYNFEVFANHNYYVGRNQILAHNKGGGKKGGGGGKAKTIEQKEKKNHEKDYYEEVDTQLEKVEKELSRVEKQQDKLVGDKARANQNKQLGLLQKQIELQKEHLRILTEEEKVDVTKHLKEQDKQAEKLVQKYNKLFVIPDPVYDEDGIISNYEQISKAVDDAHNKMIDEYNKAAKTGNEKLTKQIQKDIDSLDKYGDAIRKDAQRLDKIVVETEELNNTIQELQDSMQDIRIEAFKNYEEARDGLKDIKESAAELNTIFRDFDPDSFVNSFSIDDTPYDDLIETMNKLDTIYNITKEDAEDFYDKLIKQKEADLAKADELEERMAIQQSIEFFNSRKNNLSADNLNNGYLGVLSQDLATLQEWMDNPTSKDNVFGTDIAALTDTYKETYEALKDGFEEYRKLIQDYRDAALDIYNEAEDAIDRQMDKYDRLVEKVERMSDTYALYYGEDSYAELDKFYAQQGDIMQNQLDQLTTAYEYWNQQYQRALATGDKKLIQEIEDKMNDAEDAMLEKAEELADLWVEKFENVVNANTQSIYDKLFNGNDFNDLTDSWELQKDYMERYKDEVEKSYEIDKLRSKYLDLLNDAQGTSLQTQNKIRQQMQEQLKQLQDQASVSEYDVKLANARLEILQKQIALEDAQRNKNQMQLRRDSQGNYRYTYRANQEDVKAAQDDLLDSEFNAYELTKDETISNNDRALNMVQDFLNKRADIFNKYKDDDEARTKALEQLSADYSKLLGGMEEDFKDTTNGMYDVLTFLVKNGTEDSATSAANMLDNLFENENKFKEDTEVLWASMTNNITDALENFGDAVEEANGEMIAQTEDLKEKMAGNKGALTIIGSSADTMTDSLDKAAEATKNLASETENLYDLFGSDDAKLQDALSSIEKYKQELQDTQDTTSSLAQSLKKANATLDTKTAEAQSYKTALDFATGARQVKEGTKVKLKKGTFVHYDRYGGVQQDAEGNTGWRLPEDMWVKFDAPATERNAKYKYGFYATGDSLTSFGKKQPGDNENGRQNTDQRRHQKWWFNEDELQRNVLAAMDTGGYTGEWEDETPLYKNGKLALLHQKELVLNSSDTENILAAVEIVRTIAAGINNQLTSLSQNAGIRNFNSSLSSIGNEVQQRVEIKAEFPNVQDSYQIEQALLELSDQAYQYAHRNIRG